MVVIKMYDRYGQVSATARRSVSTNLPVVTAFHNYIGAVITQMPFISHKVISFFFFLHSKVILCFKTCDWCSNILQNMSSKAAPALTCWTAGAWPASITAVYRNCTKNSPRFTRVRSADMGCNCIDEGLCISVYMGLVSTLHCLWCAPMYISLSLEFTHMLVSGTRFDNWTNWRMTKLLI